MSPEKAAMVASRKSWEMARNLSYLAGYLAVAGGVFVLPLVVTSPGSGIPLETAIVIVAIAGLAWGGYCQRRRNSTEPVYVGAEGMRASLRAGTWSIFEKMPAEQEGWRCGPLAALGPDALGPVAQSLPDHWVGVVPAGHLGPATWRAGAALAWMPLEVEVPRLAFIPPGMDPKALAVEDPEIDVTSWKLMNRWRVFSSDPGAVESVMTPEMVMVLNTARSFPRAFFAEGSRALAVADARATQDGFARMSSVLFRFALALGPRKRAGKILPERSSSQLDKAYASAAVGDIVSSSRFYLRVGMVAIIAITVGASALLALVVGANLAPADGGRSWLMGRAAAYGGSLGVSLVVFVIAWRAMSRAKRTEESFALQVLEVARNREWTILARAAELETGWMRKPFSRVHRMRWGPAALGQVPGGTAGVASVEGDIGVGAWAPRLFASRVAWADTGVELPRMDFLREGFSTGVAKLCGGSDLDVESYAFNALWRIRTEDARAAHALLQPTMIALLTDIADEGVAYHLDGTRVVMWDDGSNSTVDLERRLELVERFVAALPTFLKSPRT